MDMQLCWSWFFLMRYSHPEIPQPILTEHKLSNSNWNIFSPAQKKITFHSKSADKKHLHFHPHISTEVISTITFISFRLNHNFFWLMAWNAVRVHLMSLIISRNYAQLSSLQLCNYNVRYCLASQKGKSTMFQLKLSC